MVCLPLNKSIKEIARGGGELGTAGQEVRLMLGCHTPLKQGRCSRDVVLFVWAVPFISSPGLLWNSKGTSGLTDFQAVRMSLYQMTQKGKQYNDNGSVQLLLASQSHLPTSLFWNQILYEIPKETVVH